MEQPDRLARQVENAARHESEMKKSARRQRLRAASKKAPPREREKAARVNHWMLAQSGDWDELEVDSVERIVPRGERDRRRAVTRAAFGNPLAPPSEAAAETPPGCLTGRVTEVATGSCCVESGGRSIQCAVRHHLRMGLHEFTNVVAVGDQVWFSEDGVGGGAVEDVLPRRTVLARPDVHVPHLRQVIVANADQLLIVGSWRDPPIWLELIDRYLIAANRNDIETIVCINKIDLADSRAELDAAAGPYREIGVDVLLTSALQGQGIDDLRRRLRGKLTVLAGLSGVGKSSLLTAIQPDFQLRASRVSEAGGQGRHTTTQATLLHLASGGDVVDTPGIREFGLAGLRKTDLAAFFPELDGVRCRFADCRHRHEPGCGIRRAGEKGQIAASRLHSFQRIWNELPG